MTYFDADIDYETIETQFHSFNVQDAKGRTIGSIIAIYKGVIIEADTTRCFRWRDGGKLADGTPVVAGMPVYRLYRQASRNGHSYGASQTIKFYATREAADAAAAHYLKHAAKRAEKLAAK